MIRAEIESLRAAGLVGRPGAERTGPAGTAAERSRCSPRPAATSSARSRRCSSAWRAIAASRGTSRRSPACTACGAQPTLMNSVETFAHVPVIARRGADWWKRAGRTARRTGLKFFAVSGHVERPGVYCVPMGTTARRAARPGRRGGRAAGRWPRSSRAARRRTSSGPDQLDVPLDFDSLAGAGSMLGSGALVVLAEGTDLLAAATNVLRFFRERILRQVRPVPGRHQQGAPHARLTFSAAAAALADVDERIVAARRRHAPDVDLRSRPGRARAGDERAAAGPAR